MRKQKDLTSIPYVHREAAANLLIAKAGRLASPGVLFFEKLTAREIAKIRQAISLYDMALLLMKPYDGNYVTIIHWKCLLLIDLQQFEEAREWYKELIKLTTDSMGKDSGDATAKGALRELEKIKSKIDFELPAVEDKDSELMDDPGFCWWASQFCDALSNGEYTLAHECLAPSERKKLSKERLRSEWDEMVQGVEVEVLLIRHEKATDDDPKRYVGWCYFTVAGVDVNEAIALEIYRNSEDHYVINSVDFGRP